MSRTLYRRFTMGADAWQMLKADCTDPELAPLNPDETSCEGATLAAETKIILNAGLPSKGLPSVVIHELLHAAVQASGIGHTMKLSLKKEEQLIHALAPFVAQALVTGGFWKTPRGEE